MRRAKSATAGCSSVFGGTAVASASSVTGGDAMPLSLVENAQRWPCRSPSLMSVATRGYGRESHASPERKQNEGQGGSSNCTRYDRCPRYRGAFFNRAGNFNGFNCFKHHRCPPRINVPPRVG